MKHVHRTVTLCVASLSALFMVSAHAQSGLRFPSFSDLPTDFSNSQLLVDSGSGAVPGFYHTESAAAPGTQSWLAATWRPFGGGVRTSLGVVMRDTSTNNAFTSNRAGESYFLGQGGTPFVGFGWSTPNLSDNYSSFTSRLKFSAELGTMVLGVGECSSTGCMRFPGASFNGDSGSMRFNPYISFGASYRY